MVACVLIIKRPLARGFDKTGNDVYNIIIIMNLFKSQTKKNYYNYVFNSTTKMVLNAFAVPIYLLSVLIEK